MAGMPFTQKDFPWEAVLPNTVCQAILLSFSIPAKKETQVVPRLFWIPTSVGTAINEPGEQPITDSLDVMQTDERASG